MSRENSSMEGDEVVFSVKLQTENLCFFLLYKLNKAHAARTRNEMQFLSTFIRTSGPVPEVKKPALINNYENIIAYSEEYKQSEV